MTIEDLRSLLARLPADGSLPVGWVREQLALIDSGPLPPDCGHLTVGDLAKRWKRGASTVRTMCERGELEGAYRFRGREWRVPRASVERYEVSQQRTGQVVPADEGEDLRAIVRARKAS